MHLKYSIKVNFVSVFFNGGIVTIEIINWYQSIGDLEELTKASFLTLSNLIAVNKFFILFRHRSKVMTLVKSLNRKEFKPKNNQQKQTLEKYVRLSQKMSTTLLSLCACTCILWTIYPFTVEGDYILPIAAWMPFNTSSSPNFELAFIYESVGTIIGGLTDLNTDCLIAGKYESYDRAFISKLTKQGAKQLRHNLQFLLNFI